MADVDTADAPVVHVLGLGPGDVDLLTTGVEQRIRELPHALLRTRRHPAARAFPELVSCDEVYDDADTIEAVYPEIVERVVAAAAHHGEVGYVVPGSPVVAEQSVELLVADDRVRTVLHPALSFVDLAWVRLGVDPIRSGARLLDGHRFVEEGAGERGPLLVAQCDHRFVLSDIKLSVEDPPATSVALLHHLGLPDERIEVVEWSEMDRTLEPDHLTSLWIPQLDAPGGAVFVRLEQLMATLREQDPWKAGQTHGSLRRYLLEETHEVLEAIDRYDPATGEGSEELCSELGDLLYQVLFHSALGTEAGWFTLQDVAVGLHDKLERRHPHVVGEGANAPTPQVEALVAAWERDKAAELGRSSVYDGIPATLPALARAAKVLRKARPRLEAELDPSTDADTEPITEAYLGEQLWALVQEAHVAGLDPEDVLRREVERRLAELRAAEQRADR